jgi:hypothetical protein
VPESDHDVADAPACERYGDDFDGRTMELWMPIKG